MTKHLPALDGLRGVAILMVVVFHTAVMTPVALADDLYLFAASTGFVGVDLFFVLSGFLITRILLDLDPTRRALMGFYARRALRTWPLYYAVLALALLVLPRFVPAEKAARFALVVNDLPYYLLHLSNVAITKARAFRHPVLDVSWSLAVEEQFYLLWPIVVIVCSRETVKRIAVAAMASALALRVALVIARIDPVATYVLTPCRMDALAVGAAIACIGAEPHELERHRATAKRVLAIAAPIALGAMFVEYRVEGSILLPGTRWPLATFGFSAVALGFGAVLVLVITAPPRSRTSRVMTSRALLAFGKYSYAIYLVHLPIRAFLRDEIFGPAQGTARISFDAVLGSELAGQMVFHALAAAVSFGVAWLSYHLFEARFSRMKRFFPLR